MANGSISSIAVRGAPVMVYALIVFHQAAGAQESPSWKQLIASAQQLSDAGKLREAEVKLLSALEQAEGFGPADQRVAWILSNLGEVYRLLGRAEKSESCFKSALRLSEKNGEQSDPRFATMLNNFGILYGQMGQLGKSKKLHDRALTLRRRFLEPGDPEIATSLLNLAALNGALRRYSEADRFGLEALRIWEETLGPEHRDVAVCLNNLAMIYWHQKRTVEAIPFARRALAIWEKTVGREHRDYIMGLTNLAALYCNTGQFEEAETLLTQAIKTVEKRGGPSPELAWILSNYAYLLNKTDRMAEAKELEQRASEIMSKHAADTRPAPVIDLGELLTSRKKRNK